MGSRGGRFALEGAASSLGPRNRTTKPVATSRRKIGWSLVSEGLSRHDQSPISPPSSPVEA